VCVCVCVRVCVCVCVYVCVCMCVYQLLSEDAGAQVMAQLREEV